MLGFTEKLLLPFAGQDPYIILEGSFCLYETYIFLSRNIIDRMDPLMTDIDSPPNLLYPP